MPLEKKDEQVLFPGVEVEGYTIRPWTLAQAVALAPTLGSLVDIAGASGVKDVLVKILDAVDIDEPVTEAVEKAFMDSWKDIALAVVRLIPQILPCAPKILSVSLDISDADVGKFDLGKTTRLLKEIAIHNGYYLKNYFGPENARQSMAS